MHYREEIDGLRALAVLPVILFHAEFQLFSGGFVGVDVFFVISGYLITSIIINDLNKQRFSLINFYERRARRILPALLLVITCCIPLAWLWLMPLDFEDFLQSLIAVPLFSSNILFWLESDYFATAAELKPLLHTWSLALEEQFYILFPLLLMFGWRFPKRYLLIGLSICFIVSLILAQWAAYYKPNANFYLLPSRGWELLMGAFAAFYINKQQLDFEQNHHRNKALQLFSLLGLGFIISAIFMFDSSTPYPSFYTLLPTLGTLLIILTARKGTWVQILLSQRLLVAIGLVSYSAYLWHQPLFAFAKYNSYQHPSLMLKFALILLCIGLSYLSWRFVELPFRNRNNINAKQIFVFATTTSLLLISCSMLLLKYDIHSNNRIVNIGLYEPENRQLAQASWQTLRQLSNNPKYGVTDNPFDQQLWFKQQNNKHKILIIGNSHSKDIFNVINASHKLKTHIQLARYGTEIAQIDQQLYDSKNFQAADTIMFVSQYKDQDLAQLAKSVQHSLAMEKQTVIVKNIYEFEMFGHRTYSDFLLNRLLQDSSPEQLATTAVNYINQQHFQQFQQRPSSPRIQRSHAVINQLQQQFPQLIVLDRMNYICSDSQSHCYAINTDFQKYFYDYGHHTVAGAQYFGQRIDQINWLQPLFAPSRP